MTAHRRSTKKSGQVLLIALVFFGIFVSVTTAFISLLSVNAARAQSDVTNGEARALAEAGVDRAVAALNKDPSYTGETGTSVGEGTFSTTVTTIDSSTKEITSTASIPNSAHPLATKTIRTEVSINSAVVSFRYGVQAGAGGFDLSGGATVNGSIYANGDINATNGVHITGSAYAADPPALSADQTNGSFSPIASCTSSNCITFGNASATQDLAQSFKISSAVGLNNLQFYIKKVGNPADATVRIVTDNSGVPSSNTLMSGTLSASLVTTSFGWVTVTLPSTPILDPSQTYWVVIDASSNAAKYYIIGANTDGYPSGEARIGKYGGSWSATSPSNLDAYFKLFLGGGTSMIGGNNYPTGVYIGTTGSDSASAHYVEGATVTGPLYCQTSSYTSKACDTSQPDPTPAAMPVSDSNIAEWQTEAQAGTIIAGDETIGWAGGTLGPAVITGDLTVNGGGTLTVSGTLWIQGGLSVSGGSSVKLASSYGANNGVIIVNGPISVAGGSHFYGSGTPGSYPFLITTSACPAAAGCSGANAISLSGGAGAVALIAQNGTAQIDGGTALKQVTAKTIVMDGGATLTYDSGLINASFSSGPGGSWAFVPGTYSSQ